jgi:hypothetical protein
MCKMRIAVVGLVILALSTIVPAAAQASMGEPATRIQFQPGATSAAAAGQLAPRQTHDYVLRAGAGQVMQVSLWSSSGTNIAIRGADGTTLKRSSDQQQSWQGTLPRTQDYTIRVLAFDQAASYCLRVTVLARIQFARGATSATVFSPVQQCAAQDGEVVGGYVLRALAHQTMRVTLTSPNHNVYLTIAGANGTTLKSYDDWSTGWEGLLPSSQDYYLLPVATGPDARFTLTVWISPLGQTTSSATRIRFAPWATSATMSGSLAPGGSARYVLWAARGQRLEMRILPAPGQVIPAGIDVSVAGPGGHSWNQLGLDSVIDPLPASGDYTITLALRPGSWGANYRLKVTIPAP